MINTYLKEVEVNGVKTFKTFANLSELHIDPENPREISDEKMNDLIDFLNKYDALEPLIVDVRPEKEGNLIGGNKRYEAYLKMGRTEAWIELRFPGSDAEAFEMATIHNMSFGNYMEVKLREQIHQFEDELGDDLEKLEASLKSPDSLDDIAHAKTRNQKMKYEIVIRCLDENDMNDKISRLAQVGVVGKTKG